MHTFVSRCSEKISGSQYQWVRIPADKIPRMKSHGRNTAVQNTAGHNTSGKIPVVIIPYWTKYLIGQNTALDKIPHWTKYRTGQNTTHDLHYALQFHRLRSQCQTRSTFMHLNQAQQSKSTLNLGVL